jgi:hypothetical protein
VSGSSRRILDSPSVPTEARGPGIYCFLTCVDLHTSASGQIGRTCEAGDHQLSDGSRGFMSLYSP